MSRLLKRAFLIGVRAGVAPIALSPMHTSGSASAQTARAGIWTDNGDMWVQVDNYSLTRS